MTQSNHIADLSAAQHNLGFETIVLGAMLTAPVALVDVQDVGLNADDFYRPANAALYRAILDAQAAGVPTEPQAIAEWLAEHGQVGTVGGLPYLHECIESVPTAAGAKWYAQRLVELADRRRIIQELARVAQAAEAGASAEHLAGIAETAIHTAARRSGANGMTCLGEFAAIGIRDVEMRRDRPRGLPTGFHDLDKLLGGLRPGQLAIVAGRPGQGKTTFALDVARHVSIKHRLVTGFFSMEMTVQEMFDRCLSAESGVPYHVVRDGHLTDRDWTAATRALAPMSEAPLYFDDTTGQTVNQIANKLRWLQARHGLDLVVLDYLGLIGTGRRSESRQQEVAEVTRTVKQLAGQLQVPILALVQLNRGSEGRTDKTPQLADIRDSGEIEQAADIVLMVHREDYYDAESARAGEVDLIVRKNRSGPQDTITVASQLHLARFVSMAIA